MPRQVENDDAEAAGDLGVVQERAILPAVGAGGVQADQRDALPRFLEIDAMRPAVEVEPQVAADDRLDDRRADRGRSARPAPQDAGAAKSCSRNSRFRPNASMSPSTRSVPMRTMPTMLW